MLRKFSMIIISTAMAVGVMFSPMSDFAGANTNKVSAAGSPSKHLDGDGWMYSYKRSGDVVTDQATKAGITSAIIGFIPGGQAAGGLGSIASAIYYYGKDTTYYTTYVYMKSGPVTTQGSVTYYYSESTRDSSQYLGHTTDTKKLDD